jgi:hypothetical protein
MPDACGNFEAECDCSTCRLINAARAGTWVDRNRHEQGWMSSLMHLPEISKHDLTQDSTADDDDAQCAGSAKTTKDTLSLLTFCADIIAAEIQRRRGRGVPLGEMVPNGRKWAVIRRWLGWQKQRRMRDWGPVRGRLAPVVVLFVCHLKERSIFYA